MKSSSVQARLDLTAIRAGVACFGSGDQAEYCAVMEVAGSQESLAKVDDAKQEELLAAYAQFLNSLTFPFQIVVQVHPVDLAWYVARVEERARVAVSGPGRDCPRPRRVCPEPDATANLLERRIYIVVPWSSSAEDRRATRPSLLAVTVATTSASPRPTTSCTSESVQRLLADRCEVISRQLGRAGLRATRLDDLGLAQLYHVAWAPEVARTQRLRRELADYTALVVGAEPRSRRPHEHRSIGRQPT